MIQSSAQVGNLTYNAAENSFQALVTFHTDEGRLRVASSYPATLDTDEATVERGLIADAMRTRKSGIGLLSRTLSRKQPEATREPQMPPPNRPRGPLDLLRWLQRQAA